MREFTVPATTTVDDQENLTDAVWANAERFAGSISFRRRLDGSWVDITAREFADQVTAAAKGLIAAGIEHGDRIALLSTTCYEWTLLDYAIWAAGGSTVPIYETSSPDQVKWILADSGAKAIVVETPVHRAMVAELIDRLGKPILVWQIAPATNGSGPAAAIDELTVLGAEISDDAVRERATAVGAEDLATLVYTSGTTGAPKGCELTHRNLLAVTKSAVGQFPSLMQPRSSVLLFLPLAHVLARFVQCCCVYARITLGHTPDAQNLITELAEFRPTLMLAVPRVFEKVYNSASHKAHAEGKGRIFDMAVATAIEWSRAHDTGGAGLALRAKHAVFDQLVYAKLRAVLGGRCVAVLSGAAPLGERLGHFFRGIGVSVLEGYGLTETSAPATANTEKHVKIGTVGQPLPGVTIRIDDDDEVLIKSPGVLRRYWHNEQATEDAIVDGWLHTGDLGELDQDGFLRITGRKKEIIVTAAGKNVSPAALEDRIRAHRLVSNCMVVGDKQPFIAALITLDAEALPTWRAEHGKPAGNPAADLIDDEDLRAEVQRAVDGANKTVSKAETIRKFRILPIDFTESGGQLTPSLKVKRAVVAKEFATEIEALYAP
ncbi:MAG: AMP-dependent synthetase/ligase [Pseudonocardiaceae bacterium]